MSGDCDVRETVEAIEKDVEAFAKKIKADSSQVGLALIEVGLRTALRAYVRPTSNAEKKLIRTHYPLASDENIDLHRLSPTGLAFLLNIVDTAARKYLDHQPEACAALDASSDDDAVNELVGSIVLNLENVFASAEGTGLSPYDATAATITNTAIIAAKRGVPIEQMAIILLEGIGHALKRAGPEYQT